MSGFVYFIGAEGSGHVKIGWAKRDPFLRMQTLQTGCPEHLFMRAYFRGSQDDERRMHRTFDALRIRGEWFADVLKFAEFLNYFDDVDGKRPLTEDELVTSLCDNVLGGSYHEPHHLVREAIYDESGDWRPWRFLLERHGLLESADA